MKENLKVSFIIPGYKCDEYIFRNIDSILDQDYKNFEIIVVLNGRWETKEDLLKGLKEKYGRGEKEQFLVVCLDTPSLANANNTGLLLAKGDIISHLSSDLYLMPGALRTWVEAFNENPDFGLVYSGYRLVSRNPLDVYYSNDFDRYHLECEPYIDGANPYRRQFGVEWNTELKSLIDWDWSLKLTSKTKGYYIKEPLYYAEKPKLGGLSDDSSANWVRRRKQVRTLHGIPDRKICLTSIVDPAYALELAKLTDCDYRFYPGYKPHDYNLIYAYGFLCDNEHIQHSTGIFYQHFNHKIIHWNNESIKSLMEQRWVDVDYYVSNLIRNVKNNFCMTLKEKEILSKMGIDAELFYLPFMEVPFERKENYVSVCDEELMIQLKKAMPDIKFVYNDLSCPITIHINDRIDRVIQSISRRNYVITNAYIHGATFVQGYTNVPEIRKTLVHAIRKVLNSPHELDEAAIKEYKKYTPEAFKRKLEKIMETKYQKYGRLEDIIQA